MSEIKNRVNIWLDGYTSVEVDWDHLHIEGLTIETISDKLPDNIDPAKVTGIDYNILEKGKITFSTVTGEPFIFDSDRYNDFIQPYVDIWQAEKDRIEQEEQDEEAEYQKFENRQARALVQLNQDFEKVKERSHIKSSLGFTIDANPTAKENVQGLIEEVGDSMVQFCDYYNQFHELNKSQLETLKSEINQNGQALYAQKWQYRTQIENCTNNEGLDAVLEAINFTYMDFSPSDTGDGEQAAEQA